MKTIVVVHRPEDWPLQIAGAEVVPARSYLTDPAWVSERNVRVFNLCRSYRYQTEGYYVSLLAAARRHRPFPDLRTVLDMKSRYLVRSVDDELDDVIQQSLSGIQSPQFELSVYFGRNLAARHARLAQRLFAQFPVPLQRASFKRGKRWQMTSVAAIAFRDVPDSHREFVAESAAAYLGRRSARRKAEPATRFDLAILYDPGEELAPSDAKAIKRFQRVARDLGFWVETIGREDYGRLAEFDALLIRETTAVDHHTFRFAQRAESEGLVVIDDPTSILRCTNKVYQAEALELRGVPIPKTLITDEVDADRIEREIGLPCVLKHPDSSFSQGVAKVSTREELEREGARILEGSDLMVVQEFMPTDYDWRIGVFGGAPLWACRYLMARGHWQIVKKTDKGAFRYGRVEPVPFADVPKRVVRTALRAAKVIGDGLYGVDVKVAGRRVVVTEVNDNPNLDAGCEDKMLGDEAYAVILRGMLARLEATKRGGKR